jgi:hypothetical protein
MRAIARVSPENLFAAHFLPLYPPDLRADREALAKSRLLDANPGGNAALANHLVDAADHFVANATALFGADLALDRSDASVHRLGAALTRERRDAWAAQGAVGTAANVLFNVVVHGTAYVGECVVAAHGGRWGVRRPLWESVVRLTSRAGEADLAIFHWWMKSLGDDAVATSASAGLAASLADRYRAHVEVPCERPEGLAVLIADERAFPRLKTPTFDRLHKYLRAHLPELRDIGEDFPTPERFAGFGFRWMDFYLVGGARMILLAGASPSGMHLFWLGARGFEKGAFFAGDAFPDPVVALRDDRIVVTTAQSGQPHTYETLWWGP